MKFSLVLRKFENTLALIDVLSCVWNRGIPGLTLSDTSLSAIGVPSCAASPKSDCVVESLCGKTSPGCNILPPLCRVHIVAK